MPPISTSPMPLHFPPPAPNLSDFPAPPPTPALPNPLIALAPRFSSRSNVVSRDHEDCHDDYIVETMLGVERSPPPSSASAPNIAPMPLVDPPMSHNSPISSNSSHAPLESIHSSYSDDFGTTQNDCCSSNSDTTTQDDFYATQDGFYAAQNCSYMSQDGFYATQGKLRPTGDSFYMSQGSFYTTKDALYTIPNKLDATLPVGDSNTPPALASEPHAGSGMVWEGSLIGELLFEEQPRGYWASGAMLAKWTFAEDGLTNVPVAQRLEGDIHFSPSLQHAPAGESFLSW
ncbi:hypothetical protein FRC06_010760, partial [Ceratobasidium sp. 370]